MEMSYLHYCAAWELIQGRTRNQEWKNQMWTERVHIVDWDPGLTGWDCTCMYGGLIVKIVGGYGVCIEDKDA